MTPIDAKEYGVIDRVVKNEGDEALTSAVMSPEQWDKAAGLRAA